MKWFLDLFRIPEMSYANTLLELKGCLDKLLDPSKNSEEIFSIEDLGDLANIKIESMKVLNTLKNIPEEKLREDQKTIKNILEQIAVNVHLNEN